MARAPASRKFQLTFNNPLSHGYDHDTLKKTLLNWPTIKYWCMCDEIGEGGTPHTHLFIVFSNPVMFTTLQKRVYGAHIEPAQGSNQENRDYIRKEGKWETTEKKETNLPDTFEEWGNLPGDLVEKSKQTEAIFAMIKDGKTNAEILEAYPSAMTRIPHIEHTRQTLLEERYKKEFRSLSVTYLYGDAGVGKTRSVMERFGYDNVYRITNYQHPFDGYKGQNIFVFDEYRSNLPISDMLNYLDGYPCMLPCRYADKVACFTTVYIISNIPLEQQYLQIQREQPDTWKAFLRRIHSIEQLLSEDTTSPLEQESAVV